MKKILESEQKTSRVLIHCLKLGEGPNGSSLHGNFFHVKELSQELVKNRKYDFRLLVDEVSGPALRPFFDKRHLLDVKMGHPSVLRANQLVSEAVSQFSPSVYYRPTGQLPFSSLNCATVMSVADLNFRYLPTNLTKRVYKEVSYAISAYRANWITCVSESTRLAFLKAYPFTRKKLSVVHHGLGQTSPPDSKILRKVKADFFLTFGHQAHKNVEVILHSMALLRKSHNQIPDLAVVGASDHVENVIKPLTSKLHLDNSVKFLGRVQAPELSALYGSAMALVFMSKYEGFGLPPLEAMAVGCPVICSNVYSLPEVVGNGGILHGPDDVEGLAASLIQMTNREAREFWRLRALSNSKRFSWCRAAKQIDKIFDRLLVQPR